MKCENPVQIKKNLDPIKYPDGMLVPCGKCLNCRVSYRREWSLRLVHELSYWDKSSFITMTYDEDNLPAKSTLVKNDLQCYFKRLRKAIEPDKIKYYAVGEYGETFGRPHYHAIIFGLAPKDKKVIKNTWYQGKVDVAIAEPKSINYVCQYIDKKFTGDLAKEHYDDKERIPIFRLVSQGIGKRYCLENADKLSIDLSCKQFGIDYSLPRYYCKLLNIDPDYIQYKQLLRQEQIIRDYTGHELTIQEHEFYFTPKEVHEVHLRMRKSHAQKSLNLKARINLRNKNF